MFTYVRNEPKNMSVYKTDECSTQERSGLSLCGMFLEKGRGPTTGGGQLTRSHLIYMYMYLVLTHPYTTVIVRVFY